MLDSSRNAQSDPTGMVDLTDPAAVLTAVDAILRARYGAAYGLPLLQSAMADLVRAFRGDYPGLLRCDTHYHDLRHALDSGLLMARLIDGHAVANPGAATQDIDAERALLGVLLALYHDIGLLRRTGEEHLEGASLTPVHEARGVEFMRDYLGRTPLAHLSEKAELIMVTRLLWHMPPDLPPRDRLLASMLGSADIMAQLADRAYLEKCRDFLFIEFSAIGLAGAPGLPYPDPQTLLEKTPAFYTDFLRNRMHTEYNDVDRYTRFHFGGTCPYEAAITRNIDHLRTLVKDNDFSRLRRVPRKVVDAR